MKKTLFKLLSCIAALIITIAILNINVSTKQGINFRVYTLKIPLYLKILDFFDRHYNYQWIVQRIIGNSTTDEEKALKIFKWTNENIMKIPKDYPIIDDHVWHIIIRGYATNDQFQDVFTTLCNYAGIDAFYELVFDKDHSFCIALSFVKIDRKWAVFDASCGVYFKNRQGTLANIKEIIKGNWTEYAIETVKRPGLNNKKPGFNYAAFLINLPTIAEVGFKRANIQSPIKRLQYEVKQWVRPR